MTRRFRRPAAAPICSRSALLSLIATISFADVLFGVNQLYMRDLTRYYYPAKQILREVVQHGEFPYWNRYFSAGQPIAANPEHEVFYPLTWLILLPSYDLGYRLHILIHIYIGLLGMYALLRSMELRPPAAWFGALSFGLGGIYLSYVNLLPILFCAAWLPLTCLFVRRFLLRRNIRDFAAAALFLGMQFLVAEPTTVMQTGLLIGMYALYRGWYATPRVSKMITRVLWIARRSPSTGIPRRRGADPPGDRSRSRLGALAAIRLRPRQRVEHALAEVRGADLSRTSSATSPSATSCTTGAAGCIRGWDRRFSSASTRHRRDGAGHRRRVRRGRAADGSC